MKMLLQIFAALLLVLQLTGCASSGGSGSHSGPTINGYIDTSVGTHW